MTRKEIDKFLANTKVYVNGKSKEIQEKLFSLGYKWHFGGAEVNYTKEPFLFIYEDMSLTKSGNMEHFSNHNNREITAEEILALEITEPTFRPFKSKEECWSEMLKHQPFGWVKYKSNGNNTLIGNVYTDIYTDKEVAIAFSNSSQFYSASEVFNNYVFTDGTPFGIKEE